MLNRGDTSEIAGNMAMRSDMPMSARLPGNRSRATAYAAIEAKATATNVAMSPIPIELTRARVKSDVEKMPE